MALKILIHVIGSCLEKLCCCLLVLLKHRVLGQLRVILKTVYNAISMHLLLRGTEDADVICPGLFPFPLLALYAGPEVRDSGRLRAGNRKFTDCS